jgi:hypothetical protein
VIVYAVLVRTFKFGLRRFVVLFLVWILFWYGVWLSASFHSRATGAVSGSFGVLPARILPGGTVCDLGILIGSVMPPLSAYSSGAFVASESKDKIGRPEAMLPVYWVVS